MCKELSTFSTDLAKCLTGNFVLLGLLVMGMAGRTVPAPDPRCRGETRAKAGMEET